MRDWARKTAPILVSLMLAYATLVWQLPIARRLLLRWAALAFGLLLAVVFATAQR